MAYDGTNSLDQLDVARPADSEDRSVVGAALRETRLLFKNVLLVAHNSDGTLRLIGTASLSDAAITTLKLADAAVSTAKLGDSVVTGIKLAAEAVTADKLASNSVTNPKLANGSVDSTKLAAEAATESKVAALAISTAKIQDNAITEPKIANGAVSNAKLASGIEVDKLAPGTNAQVLISNGTIWQAKTISGDITIDNLGAVTLNKAIKLATFADRKTRGTNGGNHGGGWVTRDLSEVSDDASDLMTFTGSEFTLTTGKYLFFARCPAFGVGKHQARLFSDQGASNAILLWGSSATAPATMQTDSIIQGYIDVDTTWTLRIEHWVQTPTAGTDLGQAASSDNSTPYANHKEVYTEGWIVKVG